MQDRLNILFLSSWYPCRNDLYNGNFVERHAESVATYANVYVIHVCSDEDIKSIETVGFVKNGVNTKISYYPKIKSENLLLDKMRKYIYLKGFYRKAFIELKNTIGKIDIIHVNVVYPIGLIAGYLKRKFKIPYVITEHWTGYLPQSRENLSFFVKKQSKRIISGSSAVFPVSESLQKSMQKLGFKANYHVIANVVDTKLFKLKDLKQNKLRFIHISTLNDKHKNVSGVLRTIKRLSDKRSDFVFTIIGDGELHPHIEYAGQLGIPEELVKFEGEKPIEGIAKVMQKNDVFILFSNYENLPCVISEAHCTGLPVISTDVGGVNEMIDDSNGLLVPTKDENALLEKMDYMIDHFNRYDVNKIREKAMARYAYEKVGKQIVGEYKKVLKRQQ